MESKSQKPQDHNQGQSLPLPLPVNQTRQQLLPQNIQNNITSIGVQSSPSLTSVLPQVSGLTQTSIPSVVGQTPNMQNISGVPQNTAGNSTGQGVPSNMFANSQLSMHMMQQPKVTMQQQTSTNMLTTQGQQSQTQVPQQQLMSQIQSQPTQLQQQMGLHARLLRRLQLSWL